MPSLNADMARTAAFHQSRRFDAALLATLKRAWEAGSIRRTPQGPWPGNGGAVK
jgi:hypothetical protein